MERTGPTGQVAAIFQRAQLQVRDLACPWIARPPIRSAVQRSLPPARTPQAASHFGPLAGDPGSRVEMAVSEKSPEVVQ